jgi:TolA-binding protein
VIPARVSLGLVIALATAGVRAAAPAPGQPVNREPPKLEAEASSPAADQRELKDFLDAHARWDAENTAFRGDVALLVQRKYEERRAKLSESYEANIRDLETDERSLRKSAVERFEAFIERYPEEPRTTPDAMFRLSELYFEEAKDQQLLAQKDLEERLKTLGPGEEAPPEPPVRFDKSVALYRTLIQRFPTYRLIDGVQYLLAYVLEQQGELEDSRDAFAELITKYPDSKFVPEAWMRIGEYWFDNTTGDANHSLELAADAYTHVAQHPDNTLYDKGLYKLGWTWYRLDRYDDAVESFVKLIDTYDQKSKAIAAANAVKGAEKKEASGGELRDEALQYTAVSFADDTWGGVDKAKAFFARLGGRSWEPLFWRKLGDIYFDQSKHGPAIEAYHIVLDKDPTATYAPEIQQRIVQAYERDRDFDKARAERDLLVKQFSEGSPWFQANKNDAEVLAKTRDIMERSIYSSAVFHHQQAQEYKKSQKYDLALTEFQAAALAYGTYLERFPHAKNLYETRFFHAETLYNSLQFEAAAAEYAKVRDDQTDGRYVNESAYAVVLALQKEIDRLEKAGKLDALPLYKAAERPKDSKITPVEIEEIRKREIDAADIFVRLLPKDEKAPELLYASGEVYYRHDQYDEARRRFQVVIDQYPDADVARFAYNLTLETYLADQNWEKVEAYSADALKKSGGKIDEKRRVELSSIELSARFKRATAMMDAKNYEDAAKLFIAAVDEDPKVEFADKALNNAAFCYQQAFRYDSALKLYERLFTQYPQSPLADTALFLVGYSAEKAFDFDKAIDRYEVLVDKYATSPKRADALFNMAHALERLQRYPEAQAAYARYAQLFPDREDAPQMLFTGAQVAERTKNWKQEIADLTDYIRRFKNNPKEKERIIVAYLKIGEAFKQLGSETAARQAFADAVADYDQRKLTPSDLVASAAAAEAKFNLAEIQFADYDKIRIEAHGKGTSFEKSLKAALTKKAEEREKVLALYRDVAVKYKRPDWIVAALYRVGYIDERFSAALNEAPIPPDLKKAGDEYVAQYQDQLAQFSVPIDERAVEAYKKAIQTARELKIATEWTRKILESLDKYDHRSFPLLKDPKQEYLLEPLSPTAFAQADGTLMKPAAPPPPAAAEPPAAPAPATPAPANTSPAPAPAGTATPPAAPAPAPVIAAPPAAAPQPAAPAKQKLGGGDK